MFWGGSQGVVKELFSQFGCVQSVELRDHPGFSQESGPALSRLFKPVKKQVSQLSLALVIMCRLIPVKSLISPLVPPPPLLPLQGFKVGYVVFQTASSVSAAKSHPRDEPLVVCTEERQVKTGSQSE